VPGLRQGGLPYRATAVGVPAGWVPIKAKDRKQLCALLCLADASSSSIAAGPWVPWHWLGDGIKECSHTAVAASGTRRGSNRQHAPTCRTLFQQWCGSSAAGLRSSRWSIHSPPANQCQSTKAGHTPSRRQPSSNDIALHPPTHPLVRRVLLRSAEAHNDTPAA
jgi:hypothetical protein